MRNDAMDQMTRDYNNFVVSSAVVVSVVVRLLPSLSGQRWLHQISFQDAPIIGSGPSVRGTRKTNRSIRMALAVCRYGRTPRRTIEGSAGLNPS
jgi:hypothetical protein